MTNETTITTETPLKASLEQYAKMIIFIVGTVIAAVFGWQQFFEIKETKVAERFVLIDKKFVAVDTDIASLKADRTQQAMIDQNLMSSINDLKAALRESDKKSEERSKETNALLTRVLMNSRGIK